jgi:deoxyadenosine kinase
VSYPPADVSESRLQDVFIGIAGLIGAGKTTLAQALGEHLSLPVYYEPVADNEYLADFYRDTARYAFSTQIYLLNRRFQQHQEIIWRGGGAVQDRTIYEDAVFARTLVDQGLMEERDYRTYLQLFKHMSNFMCRPSMIVYLDLSPEVSKARIEQRSRGHGVQHHAGVPDRAAPALRRVHPRHRAHHPGDPRALG